MGKVISLGMLTAIAILAQAPAANAGNPATRELLQRELATKVPKQWQVHVTWRDATLLAYIIPYPYQEAFDLWYKPEKLHADMLALCPAPDDPVWTQLAPDQSIAVEPTVGGKGGDSLRLMCPRESKRSS